MKSNRTKDVTKKRNIYLIISTVLWIGTTIFFVFSCLSAIGQSSNPESLIQLSDSGKALLYSISTTAIIGIIAGIIIKDKVRTFLWMACTVMGAVLYDNVGMFIVLGLWFIDEYILFNLYKYYKTKVSINKEIDLRNE